jgi:hypothetical protein
MLSCCAPASRVSEAQSIGERSEFGYFWPGVRQGWELRIERCHCLSTDLAVRGRPNGGELTVDNFAAERWSCPGGRDATDNGAQMYRMEIPEGMLEELLDGVGDNPTTIGVVHTRLAKSIQRPLDFRMSHAEPRRKRAECPRLVLIQESEEDKDVRRLHPQHRTMYRYAVQMAIELGVMLPARSPTASLSRTKRSHLEALDIAATGRRGRGSGRSRAVCGCGAVNGVRRCVRCRAVGWLRV